MNTIASKDQVTLGVYRFVMSLNYKFKGRNRYIGPPQRLPLQVQYLKYIMPAKERSIPLSENICSCSRQLVKSSLDEMLQPLKHYGDRKVLTHWNT